MELITITVQLLAQLNFVAVLAAAVAAFVLGFLWYGPVFGKIWMKYMGISHEDAKKVSQKKMIPGYIATFITVFVESMFLLFFTLLLQTAFWHAALMIWVGFIVFQMTGIVFWEGRPWGLFVINAGYRLANLLLIGFVLSFFF